MKRTNIEFMIGWLDALRRDDLDAVTAALDEQIVWHGLREEWSCQGPETVAETFAAQRDAAGEIDVIEVIGAEGHVLLHARGGEITAVEDIPLPDLAHSATTGSAGSLTNCQYNRSPFDPRGRSREPRQGRKKGKRSVGRGT